MALNATQSYCNEGNGFLYSDQTRVNCLLFDSEIAYGPFNQMNQSKKIQCSTFKIKELGYLKQSSFFTANCSLQCIYKLINNFFGIKKPGFYFLFSLTKFGF
jgi:hypothetical protein